MSKRISNSKTLALKLAEDAKQKAKAGSFAHELAAVSFQAHADELAKLDLTTKTSPKYEMLDFRIIAPNLKTGSVPLEIVSKLTEEVRKMLGYAALRLVQGGIRKKRVPKHLYDELDLRLEGILPGSSRFIVSAAAQRDLLDYGISKGAIERIFSVLSSGGKGQDFLDAVSDLGPLGAKSLREFLKAIHSHQAEAEFTWNFAGQKILSWQGDKKELANVSSALEVTQITESHTLTIIGKVELLSKRERIDLRTIDNEVIRVLYPKRLLAEVSKLHLEQQVSLYCQVTETENPLTEESSVSYELLSVKA